MKKIIYLIVLVVLIIAAVIIWQKVSVSWAPSASPSATGLNPESSQAIQNDVNAVNVESVDNQFQSIDQGINNL